MFDFLFKGMPFFKATDDSISSSDDADITSPTKAKTITPGDECGIAAVASPAMSSTTNTTAGSTPQHDRDSTLEGKEDGQTTPTTTSSAPMFDTFAELHKHYNEIGMDSETYIAEIEKITDKKKEEFRRSRLKFAEFMQEFKASEKKLKEEAKSLFETVDDVVDKQDEDDKTNGGVGGLKSSSSSSDDDDDEGRISTFIPWKSSPMKLLLDERDELKKRREENRIDNETYFTEFDRIHERTMQVMEEERRKLKLSRKRIHETVEHIKATDKKILEDVKSLPKLVQEFVDSRNALNQTVLQSLQDEHSYEQYGADDDDDLSETSTGGTDKENEPQVESARSQM